jgi:hypothetical protein
MMMEAMSSMGSLRSGSPGTLQVNCPSLQLIEH